MPLRAALLLALSLVACGGPKHEAGPPAPKPAYDQELGCVRAPADDPAACAKRGQDCLLQPPAWCSGMGAPEPPGWRQRQPCQCLCGPQILECQ